VDQWQLWAVRAVAPGCVYSEAQAVPSAPSERGGPDGDWPLQTNTSSAELGRIGRYMPVMVTGHVLDDDTVRPGSSTSSELLANDFVSRSGRTTSVNHESN